MDWVKEFNKFVKKDKTGVTLTDSMTKEIISALKVKSDLTTYLKTEANHKMSFDTFHELYAILRGDYYNAYF